MTQGSIILVRNTAKHSVSVSVYLTTRPLTMQRFVTLLWTSFCFYKRFISKMVLFNKVKYLGISIHMSKLSESNFKHSLYKTYLNIQLNGGDEISFILNWFMIVSKKPSVAFTLPTLRRDRRKFRISERNQFITLTVRMKEQNRKRTDICRIICCDQIYTGVNFINVLQSRF